MDNSPIKFSICTPVYNVEKYLERCINSVLQQTYRNFELILVDDGSTDTSGEICDSFAKLDSRISVIHKNNEGQIATRARALICATGDYVVFLDSDDSIDCDALEIIYNVISNRSVDCIIYDWRRVSPDYKVVEVERTLNTTYFQDRRELFNFILSDSKFNSLCLKCIKRDAFETIDYTKYYSIKYGEDLLQSVDILKNCSNGIFIDEALYNYTYNPSSIMSSRTAYVICNPNYTVREYVFDLLQREKIFSYDDLQVYKNYCVLLMSNQILNISKLKVKYSDKIKAFESIKNSRYYKEFISVGDYKIDSRAKRFLYELFKSGRYRLLVFIVRLLKGF